MLVAPHSTSLNVIAVETDCKAEIDDRVIALMVLPAEVVTDPNENDVPMSMNEPEPI